MNNIMHDHLNKLRIISKIRAGQRLDTTNNNGLTVYEESVYNWFKRKYYHDNKDEGVRYLSELYKSIDQSVEQLIMEIHTTKNKVKRDRHIHTAISMAENLKKSISGIENLAKTYNDYPKTTATLEGIVQDFAIFIYAQLLNVIPEERYTKIIKENVVYDGKRLHVVDANAVDETAEDLFNDVNNSASESEDEY